jgi:hypothetical protein
MATATKIKIDAYDLANFLRTAAAKYLELRDQAEKESSPRIAADFWQSHCECISLWNALEEEGPDGIEIT